MTMNGPGESCNKLRPSSKFSGYQEHRPRLGTGIGPESLQERIFLASFFSDQAASQLDVILADERRPLNRERLSRGAGSGFMEGAYHIRPSYIMLFANTSTDVQPCMWHTDLVDRPI